MHRPGEGRTPSVLIRIKLMAIRRRRPIPSCRDAVREHPPEAPVAAGRTRPAFLSIPWATGADSRDLVTGDGDRRCNFPRLARTAPAVAAGTTFQRDGLIGHGSGVEGKA